jgi:hypothetical protein
MRSATVALAAALSLTLLACGGGGSGDDNKVTPSSSVSTADFPIASAMSAISTKNFNTRLRANGPNGQYVEVSLTQTADPASVDLDGYSARAINQSSFFRDQTGALLEQMSHTLYVQASPYLELGMSDLVDGSVKIVDVDRPLYLPAQARVGDAGVLNSTTTYTDDTLEQVDQRTTRSWALEADTSTTARLCMYEVIYDATNVRLGTEADCYRIDTRGEMLGLQVTLTYADGTVLDFK